MELYMTIEKEQRISPLYSNREGERNNPHLRRFERNILDFLRQHPDELCTWDEISLADWGMSSDPSRVREINAVLGRLRRFEPEMYFYNLRRFGVFFSNGNLEGRKIGLKEIGVSLFSQGEGGGKIVPGLSVLSQKTLENQSVDANKILGLFDRLVWVRRKAGGPYLRTYLTLHQRQLLAKLTEGGFHSANELSQAAGIELENPSLKIHLSNLRRKIETEGLEICAWRYSGWVLRQRREDGSFLQPLPGLYEFSHIPPWLKEELVTLMERGVLTENRIVRPRFTQSEARILLRLARTPERPVEKEELENILLRLHIHEASDPQSLLRIVILRLRKKMEGSAPRLRIVTHRLLGYALECGFN